MAHSAYAIRMSLENMAAIASEKPNFDRQEFLDWLEEHETGYFLRDTSTVLDCRYFEDVVFFQMYMFESRDRNELFRKVLKI